jgi:hypothetical protein
MDYEEMRAFGAEHYPDVAGRSVPAQVLLAWLFANHDHLDNDEERGPIVESKPLERFVREVAA